MNLSDDTAFHNGAFMATAKLKSKGNSPTSNSKTSPAKPTPRKVYYGAQRPMIVNNLPLGSNVVQSNLGRHVHPTKIKSYRGVHQRAKDSARKQDVYPEIKNIDTPQNRQMRVLR